MFDHVVFGVSDYAASKAFFLKALEPIGMAVVAENSLGIEMSADGKVPLCFSQTEDSTTRLSSLGRTDTTSKWCFTSLEPGLHPFGYVLRDPDPRGCALVVLVLGLTRRRISAR